MVEASQVNGDDKASLGTHNAQRDSDYLILVTARVYQGYPFRIQYTWVSGGLSLSGKHWITGALWQKVFSEDLFLANTARRWLKNG